MMVMHKVLALLLLGVIFSSKRVANAATEDGGRGNAPAEAFDFGFWTSIVQCENPDAKPRLTFSKVMRCGCAEGGKYAGPCVDQGQKVLELSQAQVMKIDKELQAPSPKFNGECQQLPQVFLDSGTADSGANFDELWDAAMNSPCATDPNLEWMGRDCRDSFIPGKGAEADPATQDRSDPNKPCTIECATLYLKIAELCPRVYQLLRLDQLAPICPELQSVTVPPLPGGPVPLDGSIKAASTPAPAVDVPSVQIPATQPIEVPAQAPVEIPVEVPVEVPAEVPVALPTPTEVPVVISVAPAPAKAPSAASVVEVSSAVGASLLALSLAVF